MPASIREHRVDIDVGFLDQELAAADEIPADSHLPSVL